MGCPLECIRIVDSCTDVMPVTGGSVQDLPQAVRLACLQLRRRFAPVLESLGPDVLESLVRVISNLGFDLVEVRASRVRVRPRAEIELAQ